MNHPKTVPLQPTPISQLVLALPQSPSLMLPKVHTGSLGSVTTIRGSDDILTFPLILISFLTVVTWLNGRKGAKKQCVFDWV
jgi:hypothetical protein